MQALFLRMQAFLFSLPFHVSISAEMQALFLHVLPDGTAGRGTVSISAEMQALFLRVASNKVWWWCGGFQSQPRCKPSFYRGERGLAEWCCIRFNLSRDASPLFTVWQQLVTTFNTRFNLSRDASPLFTPRITSHIPPNIRFQSQPRCKPSFYGVCLAPLLERAAEAFCEAWV